jgi:ABC-type transporter Mla subunit MlaD
MTDENANTADLTIDEKLDRVLRKLGDLDTRLATLEAVAADRSRETRPKLDLIIAELADVREGQKDAAKRLDRIESQLRVLTEDVLNVRADQRKLEDRMGDLERRPN